MEEISPILAGHGSAEFNRHLWSALQRLALDTQKAFAGNLVALLLGGGYGRGEGGVVKRDGVERPYNDLDLVLIVENKKVSQEVLSELSCRYAGELQIHVDFSRPLTIDDIRRWPCSLMWFDLVHGHKVLAGPGEILAANVPSRLAGPVPPIEATRLLLNRGAGLLWAMRILRKVEPEPDADFIRRNFYKCALALGDSLLLAFERYSVYYTGRNRRVRQLLDDIGLAVPSRMFELYEQALTFKFLPDSIGPTEWNPGRLSDLASMWGEILLIVEKRRNPSAPSSMDDYVQWPSLREPELSGWGNWLPNLGRNAALNSISVHYPREPLYRRLPVLLGLTSRSAGDWNRDSARFMKIWNRYN